MFDRLNLESEGARAVARRSVGRGGVPTRRIPSAGPNRVRFNGCFSAGGFEKPPRPVRTVNHRGVERNAIERLMPATQTLKARPLHIVSAKDVRCSSVQASDF